MLPSLSSRSLAAVLGLLVEVSRIRSVRERNGPSRDGYATATKTSSLSSSTYSMLQLVGRDTVILFHL